MPDRGPQEAVVLRRYDLTPVRDHFMYPTDRYPRWVLLAPVSGRFSYALSAETDQSRSRPFGAATGRCASGELILCPPGVRIDRDLLEPSRFWFAEFDLAGGLEPWWPAGKVSVGDRQRLRANFRLLDESSSWRDPRRHHARTHVLTDVLITIGREHQASARPADTVAVQGAARLEQLVADPDSSVQAVADALNLSATQFTRRFREAYGIPPIRYLTELRLAKAQRLLLDTEHTVTAIAELCGYRSPFYFSRAFSKAIGESPAKFRASRRV